MTKENQRMSEYVKKLMRIPGIARQYSSGSELETIAEGKPWKGRIETGIHGTERMYGSEMVVFASAQCAAECTACIRKNYDSSEVFRQEDLFKLVKYVDKERIKEVLITGGDPLMNQDFTLRIAKELAGTNIQHIRVGTSLFRQDPKKISSQFIECINKLNKALGYIEVSPHFDHPAEFTPGAIEKIKQFNDAGIRLYAQTILLKGVNDDADTFRELAENMRDNGVEWQYVYHCVPVTGNLHLRTTVQRGFELIDSLENHKEVTGRHVPKRYAIPLPIGKVYMDPSRIIEKEGQHLWIETRYTLDSLRGGYLPAFCRIGRRGFLEVKYLDGKD